jgi:hypothetical protein
MNRTLRYVLIAAALLFGQHAALLHAFSHVPNDPGKSERGQKGTPVPGHLSAQCLAFHAVDSALPNHARAPQLRQAALPAAKSFILPLPLLARLQFDSRAPPVSS